ncbi:MAG: tripartite tricarboxylate transporter TctB family protein [Paracoccaceae bacterium]|nr:MAG: tripartite tricarboxylate transporter TctB family protein [Paracoccaceae bacterium]
MQNPRERTVDRLSGIGWMIFGAVIVAHALTMETRDYLGATFQTGPGLVPAMIGGAIAVLGLVMTLRSMGGEVIAYFDAEGSGGRRVLIALGLMMIYGLGLIGRVHFGVATFLFVTTFVFVFNLPVGGQRALAILGVKAAIAGVLVAVAVSFVFQTVFLVRLP